MRVGPTSRSRSAARSIQSRRATGDLGVVAIVVVVGIGAVIAIMLGSFLEAFFVIAVVPFAAIAVVLTFWLHGMNFSLLPRDRDDRSRRGWS